MDKVAHFLVMFCAGAAAAKIEALRLVIISSSIGVSIWKEWSDHATYGATWRQMLPDLLADALGLVFGFVIF